MDLEMKLSEMQKEVVEGGMCWKSSVESLCLWRYLRSIDFRGYS